MKTFSDTTMKELNEKGVQIGPGQVRPWVMVGHIDGPLLHFSDGQMHWLTIWERIQHRFRWTDADKLQKKLRPRLSAELEHYWRAQTEG